MNLVVILGKNISPCFVGFLVVTESCLRPFLGLVGLGRGHINCDVGFICFFCNIIDPGQRLVESLLPRDLVFLFCPGCLIFLKDLRYAKSS